MRDVFHYQNDKTFMWVIVGIAVAFLAIWLFMYLWNWLVPQVFNGNKINYWQALALIVLARILVSCGYGKHYRNSASKDINKEQIERQHHNSDTESRFHNPKYHKKPKDE